MYDSIVWSIVNRFIDSNTIVLSRLIFGYSVLLIICDEDCFVVDGVNISNCVFDMMCWERVVLLEIQQSLYLSFLDKLNIAMSSCFT